MKDPIEIKCDKRLAKIVGIGICILMGLFLGNFAIQVGISEYRESQKQRALIKKNISIHNIKIGQNMEDIYSNIGGNFQNISSKWAIWYCETCRYRTAATSLEEAVLAFPTKCRRTREFK